MTSPIDALRASQGAEGVDATPVASDAIASHAAKDAVEPSALTRASGRHVEMLVISLVAIVLCYLLVVRHDGRVAPRMFPSHPVPESCLSRTMFHVECPGCGLTRSFIELSRGHVGESLRYHRIGWLMALAVLAQIPYRILCLRYGRALLGATFPRVFGYFLIAALMTNWILSISWGP